MKVIPTRTFLVRQEDVEGGKKKDVIAYKGVAIELSDREAVKFWGALELKDAEKKKLNTLARSNKWTRRV
jgi:hypothetical protein